MNKQEVNELISATALRYGFTCEEGIGGLMQPVYSPKNYIGFTVLPHFNFEASTVEDGKVTKGVTDVEIKSSIRGMGGEPTPADLLFAASAIERGAKLTAALQSMSLSYTEHYGD